MSGCIGGGGNSESASPFVGGDSGIEFSINNLPPGIRINEPFSFNVEAINFGEFSSPIGSLEVELANTNFFQTTLLEDLDQSKIEDENSLTNSIQLFKREGNLDRGDIMFFNYDDVIFKLPAFAGDSASVSLRTCYYYQSEGMSNICISDDSYGEVCNSIGEKETFSSAGPVKIKRVYQSNSLKIGPPNLANIRSTIQFDIKYVGSGLIYSNSNDFDCMSDMLVSNSIRINSIRIGSVTIDNIKNSCGGSNLIYLDENGEATLTCNLLTYSGWTTQLGEFEERLTINLDYVDIGVASEDLSII
jgi:hypothetical protein